MATIGDTKLTVIVMSTTKRKGLLNRIIGVLLPQLTPQVELLVSTTGEQETVGAKRERLKQAACGDFICFVDDDDMISEQYISSILHEIKSNSSIDCVGFMGTLESPNGKICQVSYSLRNKDRIGRENDTFFCGVGHLTPIRREIAQTVTFGDKDSGEDSDYCKEVMEKLRSEAFINKTLYRYLARYNV